jgi:DNA-binding transcriptional regulator YiaG
MEPASVRQTEGYRRPGDPIPGDLVRELRRKSGLSEEALAVELGLRSSGKNIIVAWEAGQAVCDGPAAELILQRLQLVTTDASGIIANALSGSLDTEWNRTGAEKSIALWRQFVGVVDSPDGLDTNSWSSLFPGLAIPSQERVHGFPFVDVRSDTPVYRLKSLEWFGSIPTEKKRPAAYLWKMTRTGAFGYRERTWEEDPMSVTHGHIHVGALIELALAGTFFMCRVIERWAVKQDTNVLVRLDLHGMNGRRIVAGGGDPRGMIVDDGKQSAAEDDLTASLKPTAATLKADPVSVGLDLVQELIAPLRVDLANRKSMFEQLEMRRSLDRSNPQDFLSLGFVKSGTGS